MLPKITTENQQSSVVNGHSYSNSSSRSTNVHDFNARRKEQLRNAALKRVKAAAKNLSW